jgi:acetylglutamate kinase
MSVTEAVSIVKIGGNVIDDEAELRHFLDQFARIPGRKILIHGGGKLATDLAGKLNIPQKMIDGRRVTDYETLKIAAMVYGGWINRSLVAQLQARGCPSIGVTGADAGLILARKRAPKPIDYGFVGDIVQVKAELLQIWMERGVTPVIAPLTHDGEGQLLNTNADSIANAVAVALANQAATPDGSSKRAQVTLVYSFEKPGVLLNVNDDASIVPHITPKTFEEMKNDGRVFAGMIPKLDNACKAITAGVDRVVLGRSGDLTRLLEGDAGTTVTQELRNHE